MLEVPISLGGRIAVGCIELVGAQVPWPGVSRIRERP
jgi:hypothetical protein